MTRQPLVVVDIGNSSTKIGWGIEQGSVAELPVANRTASFLTGTVPPDTLRAELPAGPVRWAIASVHREGSRLLGEWIAEHRPEDTVRHLSFQDFPLPLRVLAPERVGVDRLAAAVSVNCLRSAGVPAIVIDAGSAITVDLVAADGAFEGGAILPGFQMSAEALYGADLLPLALLEPNDQPPPALGKDTRGAIHSGLFWGAVGAVRELVCRLSSGLDVPPQVFVTGGDLRQLAHYLPGSCYLPNLVLSGIAVAVDGENRVP